MDSNHETEAKINEGSSSANSSRSVQLKTAPKSNSKHSILSKYSIIEAAILARALAEATKAKVFYKWSNKLLPHSQENASPS